ncbi:MAG: hypothetical protein IJM25_12630 [Eubacterium sp.]|nr:hypothetical protein [Eubacterium sp.]
MSDDQRRREAADRLMDAITDLDDEMILSAEGRAERQKNRNLAERSRRTGRMVIVSSAAAVLLAGVIALGIILGRSPEERSPVDPATEAGTEAGVTEAGVTEAGTETGVTEAGVTEAGPTEAGTSAALKDSATHMCIDGKTDGYDSLSELEQDADVILRGIRLDQEKARWYGTSGYTLSGVEITGIYKDTTEELSEGRIITVLENEVYDETSNTVYHIGGYNMMVAGKEYLLFLKKDIMTDGTEYYVSCGVNYGTVSVTDDGRDISPKYPGGADTYDMSLFRDIWQEALDKYR